MSDSFFVQNQQMLLQSVMSQLYTALAKSPTAQAQQANPATSDFAALMANATPQTSGYANAMTDSTWQARPSDMDGLIVGTAQRYGLSPSLLKAIIHAESGFSPTAESHAGAQGLMQLMPATAEQLGVDNPLDPAQNVDGGARFLRYLLDKYGGNEALALAAYNAGPGAVDRYGGIPPYAETQTYVNRVMNLHQQYFNEWVA